MNDRSLLALDNEGLRLESARLDRDAARASEYDALRHIVHGKFILRELHDRREDSRKLYSHINPMHENALVALMDIQARERETEEWINRIEQGEKRLEEIRAQRESLGKIVEHRKKQASTGDNFIPGAMRKERTNDTGRRESSAGAGKQD